MKTDAQIMALPESELSNAELLRKAAITTNSILTAGKLSPAQAEMFVDFVLDETGLKDKVRIIKFRNDIGEINKIGVHRRVAQAAADAVDPGYRSGISTNKVNIEPQLMMVAAEIGDDFKRENLEGESVEEHIIRMLATQFANDMEDLYLNGDKLGSAALEEDVVEGGSTSQYVTDTFLQLQDGWLRLMDGGNVYDAQDSSDLQLVMHQMLRSLPTKFRKRKADMKWLMSPDLEQNYRYKLRDRDTSLGDAAIGGSSNIQPWGVEMWSLPLFPTNPKIVEHVTLSGSPVALRYKPLVSGSDVVTATTLGGPGSPATPFTGGGTDYTFDDVNGTLVNVAPGIPNGTQVKITYEAGPQIALTFPTNLVLAMGLDVTVETDRDIFKRVDQIVLTAKVGVAIEELSACVKAVNVKDSVA